MSIPIEFPDTESPDALNGHVVLPAVAVGNRVECRIPVETLLWAFAAGSGTLLGRFRENRGAIERIARRMIAGGRIRDGVLTIAVQDVRSGEAGQTAGPPAPSPPAGESLALGSVCGGPAGSPALHRRMTPSIRLTSAARTRASSPAVGGGGGAGGQGGNGHGVRLPRVSPCDVETAARCYRKEL